MKMFPKGAIPINYSWYDIILMCLVSTGVIYSIYAYHKTTKNEKKFEAVAEGFKGLDKSINDTIVLVVDTQTDFNQKFEWLYEQITKAKDNP